MLACLTAPAQRLCTYSEMEKKHEEGRQTADMRQKS